MNPYDFVPIEWNNPPERHPPSPHDRFSGVSGRIEGTITAETPVFIFHSPKRNSGAEPFITNQKGQHIIPGSSLKGLFRNLVETIGNGCFLLFDRNYESRLPRPFQKCSSTDLCIACRMFGTIQGSNLLQLGKISFSDAVEVKICKHETVYTIALMGPKPRHEAFYLNPTRKTIAGRKFYFHQPREIQTESRGSRYNQHIQPIDKGSRFSFSVQFTNLEDVELQIFLYAFVLEPEMCHKIGYGKPAGFGSASFDITKLTLIDYANRYTTNQGTIEYADKDLEIYLSDQTQSFATNNTPTLNALRRIWRWDLTDTTHYRYPAQEWFEDNPGTPISGTP